MTRLTYVDSEQIEERAGHDACPMCGAEVDPRGDAVDERKPPAGDAEGLLRMLATLMDESPIALEVLLVRVGHPDYGLADIARVLKRDQHWVTINARKASAMYPRLAPLLCQHEPAVVQQRRRRELERLAREEAKEERNIFEEAS